MSRPLRPLFRPEVLRQRLRAFVPPPEAVAARQHLVALYRLLRRGDAKTLTEENLKPGFIADVFGAVLGYRTPGQAPESFTLMPEFPVKRSGGTADAVLGHNPGPHGGTVVAVEIKGPRDPLDLPHGGRRLSAVEQGFDYAINLGCDWIVVSSLRETRLYCKRADRFSCEVFPLADLAENDAAFRRFLYILGAERVLAAPGQCHLDDLLEASKTAGEDITRQYYKEYSNLRNEAFSLLQQANPDMAPVPLLAATQKILDRVLFCAFAEDRGLLPAKIVQRACDHTDPFNPRPTWENFTGLFRAIDLGNENLHVPRYNGGLFAADPALDALKVPNEVCTRLKRLADFDYRAADAADALDELPANAPLQSVDVEILGHIFEQSITDLERLRLELEGKAEPATDKKAKSRRKKEGAFYTPKFITRWIVEQTLGPVLRERLEALRLRHLATAKGSARKPLEDPATADTVILNAPQREALIAFWVEWQTELGCIRVLDPACGSGAFLIEAFDQLLAAYQDANSRLEDLRGAAEALDLSRQILQENLYGVDLNDEAVEICRLSLWIKTAERGKILADLDHSIRIGNSIVADPAVHPRAFDWHAAFPEVFAQGGFDVVIGNPPYIRQEWLAPYKDYLKSNYAVFSGTADLYLYFIERGLAVLKDGGRLGFITSGTFARGNFAVPFRQWLPTVARFGALVNFGENQPFEDAEMVYPTMFALHKQVAPHKFPTLFIHEQIPQDIGLAMESEALYCDDTVYEGTEWTFRPPEMTALFNKIMAAGKPLGEVCAGRMYRGVLTGLNEAFIIDTPTRDALVASDPKSSELLRPLLMGEDLRPWYQEWEGRWLIGIPSGFTTKTFGHSATDDEAWQTFSRAFPAVARLLGEYEEAAKARTDQGEYWWELRSCAYYDEFDLPKIMWAEIAKLPRFSWDEDGLLVINKAYIIPECSPALLTVLQSRVSWFILSQTTVPLRLRGGLWQYQCIHQHVSRLPIPPIAEADVPSLSALAQSITALARERHGEHKKFRHRVLTDLATEGTKLNNALTAWWTLDFKTFRAEVAKALKNDIPLREREDWEAHLSGARATHDRLTAQIVALEEELNDRVYRLFGLTPAEVKTLEDFMRRTKTFYPLGEV